MASWSGKGTSGSQCPLPPRHAPSRAWSPCRLDGAVAEGDGCLPSGSIQTVIAFIRFLDPKDPGWAVCGAGQARLPPRQALTCPQGNRRRMGRGSGREV